MRIISLIIILFIVKYSFAQTSQNSIRTGNTLQQNHSKIGSKSQANERQPTDLNIPVPPSKTSVKKQESGVKREMIPIDPNRVVKSNR